MRKLLWLWMIWGMVTSLRAQMPVGQDTLYGMEWIQPAQTYLKFGVAEDGFYRIPYEELVAQGWPVDDISSAQFQLYHAGQPVYFHSSTDWDQALTNGDYLLFYGTQNRGALDYHLYRDPDNQQLNPEYSLHSDTAAYYLSWSEAVNPFRFETLANDLTNLPAPEAYVWRQAQTVFSTHFLKEYYRISGSTLYYSHMGIGEGYGNRSINQLLQDGSTSQTIALQLRDLHEPGPATRLRTRYVAALFEHDQQLSVNGVAVRRDSFQNWRMLNVDTALPAASRDGERLELQWDGLGGAKDEVSVGYVLADYPARPRWTGAEQTFSCLLEGTGSRQQLNLSDYGDSQAVLYDLTNGYRLLANAQEELLRFGLPAASNTRQLAMLTDATAVPALAATPVLLSLPETNDADYLILTHSALRGEGDPVQAYADYRASAAGGSYRTAVVEVDQLYDLFGYGVAQHPMAIRNFLAWQRRENPNFEFLFIIGKGREYNDIRTSQQLAGALGSTLFVPTFGFPGSDNLLVSSKDKPTPLVATGRLAATNPGEVRLYLQKIQDLEANVANAPQTIEGKGWMKQVLHLGGGATAGEQQSIRYFLNQMGDTLANSRFGGSTTSFFKTTSDNIQVSITDGIFDRINEGVSMLSFFGHSSAGTFDFSIDNPDNYLNVGKYPLMLSLGCYSGNAFTAFRSIGERFIFLENGGAGAYGASRGLGFIHSLGAFGRRTYQLAGDEMYGQPIGKILQATIKEYENFTDQAYGTLMEQFMLQGDPAIRLNPIEGQDYTLQASDVRFEPAILSLQQDSFDLLFDVFNLGQRLSDSIEVLIEQVLPGGEKVIRYSGNVLAPAYRETIRLRLPSLGRESEGINTLLITLDPDNLLAEVPNPAAEFNNELVRASGEPGVPLYIVGSTAQPAWPPPFALVGGEEVVLKVNTADPFAPEQKYYLEIDTTQNFSAPLATTILEQAGGVLRWSPGLNWRDSTVYYWRVSPDPATLNVPDFLWESSSFTFVEGTLGGFGLGHAGQWLAGDFEQLKLNEGEHFAFQQELVNIRIRNKVWEDGDRPGLSFNNEGLASSVRPWRYLDAGVGVVVYIPDDPNGFWRNPPPGATFEAGDYGVPTGNSRVFAFRTATLEERQNLMTFLEEVVPQEAYVFFFTLMNNEDDDIHASEWALDSLTNSISIFQIMEREGASKVRELAQYGTIPYIFMYQKSVGPIAESFSLSPLEEANAAFDLPITLTEGTYRSPIIGPAQDWQLLYWSFKDLPPGEVNELRLLAGANSVELDTVWRDTLRSANGRLDLSTIDLSVYSFLRLDWQTADVVTRTPAAPAYWHLTYTPLPDLTFDPGYYRTSYADTLPIGAPFILGGAITNLSSTTFNDSFDLRYTWQTSSAILATDSLRFGSLQLENFHSFDLEFPTLDLNASPQLLLQINPLRTSREGNYRNNVSNLQLTLTRDVIDPVVQIAFDGERILEGAIVATEPEVVIELIDENEYLALDNPALFEVEIIDPNGIQSLIRADQPDIRFTTTFGDGDNRAAFAFNPSFTVEGTYQLNVKARDVSGNSAGRNLKELTFEVYLTSQLSNLLPYPNPFSTSTTFVYTLTGSRSISDATLQIMTISGRLVRQVSGAELGELRIGTHQTDFVWDGRDDYGDQLANGVYLYRLILPKEVREEVEVFSRDQVDRYFTNDLGKVVLLR